MPAERSDKFGETLKRLGEILGKERPRLFAVFALTVVSVTLVVLGPKLLGEATNIIVQGVMSGQGIDFDALHSQLITVLLVYVGVVRAVVHVLLRARRRGATVDVRGSARRSNASSTTCHSATSTASPAAIC